MITVMVPTKDRADFLGRLLDSFAEQGFDGVVAIADASGPEHVALGAAAVERVRDRLRIDHVPMKACGIAASVAALCARLETPYAVLCADDDLLLADGLRSCVAFLESHPGHAAAHGAGVMLRLDREGPFGAVAGVGPYAQPVREEATVAERVVAHLRDYGVTLFSVTRADVWRAMWEDSAGIADTSFAAELLPCCMTVAAGAVGAVDPLTLVRQVHERRYLLPDLFDWVTSPVFPQAYAAFAERLAAEVSRRDGVEVAAAREAVKEGFWGYIGRGLANKQAQRYGRIPGKASATRVMGALRSRLPGGASVSGMSAPGSPHREAFAHVLAAVEPRP